MTGITKKRGLLRGDLVVWAILIVLSMVSVVEVYSASSNMTYTRGNFWDPVVQHAALVGLGLALAWLMHVTNLGIIKLLLLVAWPISLLLLGLLLLTGHNVNGAARFIPILGFTFQPSEMAKLSLCGVAALILSLGYDKKRRQTRERAFLIFAFCTLLTCLLIFSENLSTAIIIALVMFTLAWIAAPPRKLFYGLCAGVALVAFGLFYTFKHLPEPSLTRLEDGGLHRMATWIHRLQHDEQLPSDPRDYDIHENVQVTHARIAIATAGISGRGAGKSEERDFLPQAYSDFIYAIIIEEGGLIVGGVGVMVLYLLLMYRSTRIARRCKNRYPAYLVMGISLMLVVQALVNMAVAVGALPVTGQTLPLVSKGGTSILMSNIGIGIILKVSYAAKRKERNEAKAAHSSTPAVGEEQEVAEVSQGELAYGG